MAEGCRGPSQRLKSMDTIDVKDLSVTWREYEDAQYKPRSIRIIVANGFILFNRIGYPCVRDNRGKTYMDHKDFIALRQAQGKL